MQHLHMTIKFYLSLLSVQEVCWYVEFWYILIAKTAKVCLLALANILLRLHPNTTSWPIFITLLQQPASRPPQPGPGSAPQAARQHQMSPEHRHRSPSSSWHQQGTCSRESQSAERSPASSTAQYLGTSEESALRDGWGWNKYTEFKLGITGARQSKNWVTAENGTKKRSGMTCSAVIRVSLC